MFSKILIANRGEIACRIIKTCKSLGIKTVAIYSSIDMNAKHVKEADEAYQIGDRPSAKESYLLIDEVIRIAKEAGAEAVHPGYGFLSENYLFNIKLREAGIVFIGPEPEPMRLLGSKIESRDTMIKNNIPVVPGFKISEVKQSDLEQKVTEIGLPVLIKASAGGGGKGMRVVRELNNLIESIDSARREASSSFGDDAVFIEKYIENPRHIEVQIVADKHSNVIHLYERECSLQRRHQKIIEETPSIALTDELRNSICETAKQVIKSVNYDNVATVEFLLDNENNYYFLEVNTRIQVEHPITELVTSIDIVKMQLEIAFGYKLSISQYDVFQKGHSIECRIYAEDGEKNFIPSAGKIHYFNTIFDENVRLDNGVVSGDEVSVHYDPMIAKLIVYSETREKARLDMITALRKCAVLGVKNSIELMINILNSEEFIQGRTYTNTIEKHIEVYSINNQRYKSKAIELIKEFNLKNPKIKFQDVWKGNIV
jgi:acetyl-CoA carboxylase biotin carboxylase subunit